MKRIVLAAFLVIFLAGLPGGGRTSTAGDRRPLIYQEKDLRILRSYLSQGGSYLKKYLRDEVFGDKSFLTYWHLAYDSRMQFLVFASDYQTARQVCDAAAAFHTRLQQLFGSSVLYDSPAVMQIWDDESTFVRATGLRGAGGASVQFAYKGEPARLIWAFKHENLFTKILRHEIVHLQISSMANRESFMGKRDVLVQPPYWLHEGLAEYLTADKKRRKEFVELVYGALKGHRALRINLNASGLRSESWRERAKAYSFVSYIASAIPDGRVRLKNYITYFNDTERYTALGLSQGKDFGRLFFEKAFQGVGNPEEIQKAWCVWARQHYARSFAPAKPETASEPAQIAPGDRMAVTSGPAPVGLDGQTLTTVEVGIELTAEKVQGDWVWVTVEKDGKQVSGWIHVKWLKIVSSEPAISRKLLSFPPILGPPALTRDQAIAVALVDLKTPLIIWVENPDKKTALRTPFKLTADQVQSLKVILGRAQSHRTGATEGTVWSWFYWVPVTADMRCAALTDAVKAMGLALPAKVSVSMNAKNSIWLMSRCPGPFRYFSVPTKAVPELADGRKEPTATGNKRPLRRRDVIRFPSYGIQISMPNGWKAIDARGIKTDVFISSHQRHADLYVKKNPDWSAFIQKQGGGQVKPTICIIPGKKYIENTPGSGNLRGGAGAVAAMLASQLAWLASYVGTAPKISSDQVAMSFTELAGKRELTTELEGESIRLIGVALTERWSGEPVTIGSIAPKGSFADTKRTVEAIIREIESAMEAK